jgi:hypothetical protein
MPLSELLDELFRVYRRHFTVIAGVSLLLVLPGLLTNLLSGAYRANSVSLLVNLLAHGGNPAAVQAFQQGLPQVDLAWNTLGSLVTLVLIPFALGAVYQAASAAIRGEPVTIGHVLGATAARYWPLWGLALLFFVALVAFVIAWALFLVVTGVFGALVGWIIFIPLGFWVGIRLIISVPALLVEGIGPIRAIRRSWDLVRGSWWRSFGILVVTLILELVLYLVFLAFFQALAAIIPGVGDDLRSALSAIGTTLVSALIGPLAAIVVTLLYFDLRVRTEGYDLDQLAQQTGPATP